MARTGSTEGISANSATDLADDSADPAVRTLLKHGLIKKKDGAKFNTDKLASILKRIAAKAAAINGAGATAVDESIRAVVDLLQDTDTAGTTNMPDLAILENIKAQEEKWTAAATKMEKITEMAYLSGDSAYGEVAEKVDVLTKAVQALETAAKEAATARLTDAGDGARIGGAQLTFAQAVAKTVPKHVDAVARVELMKRQVVLRGNEGAGIGPFKDVAEKDIMAKARAAVEAMTADNLVPTGGIEFLHARKTARGGAILVTKTEEAATWLKLDENMGAFSEKMGGALTVKADLCMLIAEYVPTSFEPDEATAFGQVEISSGIPRGAIKEARYIKDRLRRRAGQRTAHMIIGFADPLQANTVIRNGLVIDGKHVSMRRHRVDPHRCLKCQQVGVAHRAADCKSIHDSCGRCGAMHRTAECKVQDRAEFRCVNCKVSGHAAIDRHCPVFLQKMKEAHVRYPDYAYRFFPTHDPETWEREDYGLGDGSGTESTGWRRGEGDGTNTGGTGTAHRHAGTGPQGGREPTQRSRDNGWPNTARTRMGEDNGSNKPTGSQRTGTGMGQAGTLRQTTLDGERRGRDGWTTGAAVPAERRVGRGTWGHIPELEGGPTRERMRSNSDSSLYA